MSKGGEPTYDLAAAKLLVQSGNVMLRGRARNFILNRYGHVDMIDTVNGVFESMQTDNFVKAVELDYLPGVFADVYEGMMYDGIDWYVKFFVDKTGNPVVDIWSMSWSGSVH